MMGGEVGDVSLGPTFLAMEVTARTGIFFSLSWSSTGRLYAGK